MSQFIGGLLSLVLLTPQLHANVRCIETFVNMGVGEIRTPVLSPRGLKISIIRFLKEHPQIRVYPDFSDSEALSSFSKRVGSGDFMAVGDRILLVLPYGQRSIPGAMDGLIANELISKQVPFTIKELPQFEIYDVTKSKGMDEQVLRWLGQMPWDERPNCWNLCQLYTGWAKTTFMAEEQEFSVWLDGPFAQKVSLSGGRIKGKRGDIIAIRLVNPKTQEVMEVHGAVLITDELVLTKNGAGFESYRLMPIKNMQKIYMPRLANSVEVFRVENFETAFARSSIILPVELKAIVTEWMDMEAEHGSVFINKRAGVTPEQAKIDDAAYEKTSRKLARVRRDLSKRIEQHWKTESPRYENRTLSKDEEVVYFFLKLMRQRSQVDYF